MNLEMNRMMDTKELRTRSANGADLHANLVALATGRPLSGHTREMDTEVRRVLKGTEGFVKFQPDGIMTTYRALVGNVQSAGGALVGSEVEDPVHALRPFSIVARAGGLYAFGLVSDVSIPRESTAVTVNWIAPLSTVTPGDPATGAISLTPHRLVGCTRVDRQLDKQSTLAMTFAMRALTKSIAAETDKAMLVGTGTMGSPLGVMNVANVNTVAFSGSAATTAKLASFERKCADGNADDGNIIFVAGNQVRERWRQIARLSNGGLALWEGNQVLGRTAYATSAMGDQVIAGDLSNTLTAFWGPGDDVPINLQVNPFTRSLQGELEVLAELFVDCAVLQPAAFCRNSDSAIV